MTGSVWKMLSMSTNKPSIGPVVLEIAPWLFRKAFVLFLFVRFFPLKIYSQHTCLCAGYKFWGYEKDALKIIYCLKIEALISCFLWLKVPFWKKALAEQIICTLYQTGGVKLCHVLCSWHWTTLGVKSGTAPTRMYAQYDQQMCDDDVI